MSVEVEGSALLPVPAFLMEMLALRSTYCHIVCIFVLLVFDGSTV